MIPKTKAKNIAMFSLGALIGVLVLFVAMARLLWHGKYYPGVYIGSLKVAGMSREAATLALDSTLHNYHLPLTYNGVTWQLPSELVDVDVTETTSAAYRFGRRFEIRDYGSLISARKEVFVVKGVIDESALNHWVDEITPYVEITPIPARAEIVKGVVKVTNGSDGVILDRKKLVQILTHRIELLDSTPIEVPLKQETRQLTEGEMQELQTNAEALLKDTLVLTQDDEKITLTAQQLAPFLTDRDLIRAYVTTLATTLNRPPQDAKFTFLNDRVEEFAPALDGVEVSVDATVTQIVAALGRLVATSEGETVAVVATRTKPKISTSTVNDLGIVERIGRGESYYAHSIPNRIYNVGLAASRVNGALLAPGEVFSFNKFVGEISGATGYKTAYVISGGRTVLGDGGGVCQVSTTLFRAAMNAGLPITERWGHAYRVGYYEQNSDPGLDATVYSPSKDFKFVNDTPAHILIQVTNDPKNLHLVFEIYGTKDARVATVSKARVWGVSPPPPDLYEDDPNLPAGTIKQVDWAAKGARTAFDYKVERNGEVLVETTYTTNYRPWQNVYIRGTGGAPAQ